MDPIIAIGEPAPQFELTDLDGEIHKSEDYLGLILVLNFWSAECDWCKRVDQELLTYLDRWKDQVRVLWIASNANESKDLIESGARQRKIPIVLLDDAHKVADRYAAQTTPHFFVIDPVGKLRYQGAWDDITFRHREASRVYMPEVIEALRHNRNPDVTQTAAYGCVLVRYPE